MGEWRDETCVKVYAGPQITGITNEMKDGYSTIFRAPFSDQGRLGRTCIMGVSGCIDTVNDYVVRSSVPEIDIQIARNPQYPWFVDVTGGKDLPSDSSDFYQNVLHEIGHALLQEHIIDSNELMHSEQPPGFVSAANRKTNITSNTLEGAEYIRDESIEVIENTNDCEILELTFPCNLPDGRKELASQTLTLKVYPNPIQHKVAIRAAFHLQHSRKVNIRILDLTGSIVQTYRPRKFIKGKHQIKLDHSLQSGMYLLSFQYDQKKKTKKILIAH